MQDKVVHELLRDLVGTAKANGNTDEIVAEIEKRIDAKEQQISRLFKLLDKATSMLD